MGDGFFFLVKCVLYRIKIIGSSHSLTIVHVDSGISQQVLVSPAVLCIALILGTPVPFPQFTILLLLPPIEIFIYILTLDNRCCISVMRQTRSAHTAYHDTQECSQCNRNCWELLPWSHCEGAACVLQDK